MHNFLHEFGSKVLQVSSLLILGTAVVVYEVLQRALILSSNINLIPCRTFTYLSFHLSSLELKLVNLFLKFFSCHVIGLLAFSSSLPGYLFV